MTEQIQMKDGSCQDADWLHPRPLRQRDKWTSLNGEWQFCNGRDQHYASPGDVDWQTKIIVPFSPETPASGLNDSGFYHSVWYRKSWQQPALASGERLLLHFEAVDWSATVWVNGTQVCTHEGGYTPFEADITEALIAGSTQEVVVRAVDDPSDLAKPRGKQDWTLEPHSIWYPRTTGIWQTVWLEAVPATRLNSLQWYSSLDRWEIGLEAVIHQDPKIGEGHSAVFLSVRLSVGPQLIAHDRYLVVACEVHRRIALSDPGIDDYRNWLLWSPASPTLIDAVLELHDESGTLLDTLRSYTALRSVSTQGDKFMLNGRPLPLRLVLDQGYWVEGGLTAPNDEALRQDVMLAKRMGFNGVRKHQKIECARYLYWADRCGLLVWEEMPSAYRYTTRAIQRLTAEWLEVLQRDRSHPCIVAWVPFNESWGVPNLPESSAQRSYVQALYHLTKALDPSRPVVGNDGWESIATDIIGIHDYDNNAIRLGIRYGLNAIDAHLFKRERPGGRMLTVGGEVIASDQPIVLTEFGGICYGDGNSEAWGYSLAASGEQLQDLYSALLETVRCLPTLAGFCYTQFADTYQESNGLLFADRTPKLPIEQIARATGGPTPDSTAMDDACIDNFEQR